MNWLKATVLILLGSLVMTAPILAGTIHTWTNGEALTASDLNAVLQHLHNTMVGGHGARLVNADVNASAAIAQSKLADYHNLPRAWARVSPSAAVSCGVPATSCTFVGSHVTSITGAGSGRFIVLLDYTPTDTSYGIQVTASSGFAYDGGSGSGTCVVNSLGVGGANEFTLACYDLASPTLLTQGFTFSVFDNN